MLYITDTLRNQDYQSNRPTALVQHWQTHHLPPQQSAQQSGAIPIKPTLRADGSLGPPVLPSGFVVQVVKPSLGVMLAPRCHLPLRPQV